MERFKKYLPLLCAASALLVALAWPAHEAFVTHAAGEDCRVCSISCFPELNADCGSRLLARPKDFLIYTVSLPGLPVTRGIQTAFFGRAPPR